MTVDQLLAIVAARWPALRVDAGVVAEALAARGLAADHEHAADVALACALAAGDAAALEVFEREIVTDIRGALARIADSADRVEDMLQQTREKLLVSPAVRSESGPLHLGPGRPRIVEYRGRGTLAAWVQIVAIRELLSAQRRARRDRALDDDPLLLAVEADPALAVVKHRYRPALADAFRASLQALSPRDRALLRMSFVDAVSSEHLAAMYSVHRVTVFRWLCDARANLLDGIREALVANAHVAEGEVDSLIRALASSFDVSW